MDPHPAAPRVRGHGTGRCGWTRGSPPSRAPPPSHPFRAPPTPRAPSPRAPHILPANSRGLRGPSHLPVRPWLPEAGPGRGPLTVGAATLAAPPARTAGDTHLAGPEEPGFWGGTRGAGGCATDWNGEVTRSKRELGSRARGPPAPGPRPRPPRPFRRLFTPRSARAGTPRTLPAPPPPPPGPAGRCPPRLTAGTLRGSLVPAAAAGAGAQVGRGRPAPAGRTNAERTQRVGNRGWATSLRSAGRPGLVPRRGPSQPAPRAQREEVTIRSATGRGAELPGRTARPPAANTLPRARGAGAPCLPLGGRAGSGEELPSPGAAKSNAEGWLVRRELGPCGPGRFGPVERASD